MDIQKTTADQLKMFPSSEKITVSLYPHQRKAIDELRTGSILCGGVGSGKSRTGLGYFYKNVCGCEMKKGRSEDEYEFSKMMMSPRNLYIITTPRKRDTREWDEELSIFGLSRNQKMNPYMINVTVDSWNNVGKYVDVQDAFFIFDEQRAIGSGAWGKALIKIAKTNDWIMLSATPGDVWMDYCTVFVANGFYKNKTDFVRRHVIYDRFAKYPKIKKYFDTDVLEELRDRILVTMPVKRDVIKKHKYVCVSYPEEAYADVAKRRWNIFKNEPCRDAGELCRVFRRIVNSDPSRVKALEDIVRDKKRVIVFYTHDYERELIRKMCKRNKFTIGEWSGHRHDIIPPTDEWVFLVQYTAGSEGWNCVKTDTIVFYSQSYSYKAMIQAAGRTDRINTPFDTLYYYHLITTSSIDDGIKKCLDHKRDFNAKAFEPKQLSFAIT